MDNSCYVLKKKNSAFHNQDQSCENSLFFFEWILPLINLLSDDDETSGDGYGNYDNYDEADMKSVEDDDMDEASGSLVNCQAH